MVLDHDASGFAAGGGGGTGVCVRHLQLFYHRAAVEAAAAVGLVGVSWPVYGLDAGVNQAASRCVEMIVQRQQHKVTLHLESVFVMCASFLGHLSRHLASRLCWVGTGQAAVNHGKLFQRGTTHCTPLLILPVEVQTLAPHNKTWDKPCQEHTTQQHDMYYGGRHPRWWRQLLPFRLRSGSTSTQRGLVLQLEIYKKHISNFARHHHQPA